MNEYAKTHFRNLFKTIQKNLEERNIEAKFFETQNEAKTELLSSIKDKSVVGYGGSETLSELNIVEELRNRDITLCDRYKPGISKEEKDDYEKKALTSDIFLSSVNAISLDGSLHFIDLVGNRVAPILYGPKKVILITGINKICPDRESAYKRIKFYPCPLNTIRLNKKTPCAASGICNDCKSSERICGATVVIDFVKEKGRLKLFLVNEELGF
jgi:hypothetical protein